MNEIRILLADDQVLFVEGLKMVLETRTEDMRVVGIAQDGNEAVELTRRHRPDLVLLDVRMPNLDGVQACKTIHEEFPGICILMLTTFDDDDYVYEALNHGATGYLLKDIPVSELVASVRAAKEGSILISPAVANKLVRKVLAPGAGQQPAPEERPAWLEALSRREKEILLLIAKGYDNNHIATELYISEQTVKNYVSSIYNKLEIHDRIRVMQVALKAKQYLLVDSTC